MKIDVHAILLIVAILCFALSAVGAGWSTSKVNLMAAGLFCLALAMLIGSA